MYSFLDPPISLSQDPKIQKNKNMGKYTQNYIEVFTSHFINKILTYLYKDMKTIS